MHSKSITTITPLFTIGRIKKFERYFRNLGISELSDLIDLYADAELMTEVKNEMTKIEFSRFLSAPSKTTFLMEKVVPASTTC